MSKFAGLVGYVTQRETAPGVWTSEPIEKRMRGDIINAGHQFGTAEKVNDDVTLRLLISLVGDAYSYTNFASLRYIVYLGVKWKVESVQIARPRLILTLGGMWNG